MTEAILTSGTREIVVDELFAHAPETIWKALTSGELIGRWLMPPTGFAPEEGNRFTFRTTPAGAWDGVIHCQVLEVRENARFVYSWKGGHESNSGYGSKLETIVAWTLTPTAGGTRVRVVHSGFELPRNETAFKNMGEGWKKVVRNLDAVAAGRDPAQKPH